jgi:hypothetical protein
LSVVVVTGLALGSNERSLCLRLSNRYVAGLWLRFRPFLALVGARVSNRKEEDAGAPLLLGTNDGASDETGESAVGLDGLRVFIWKWPCSTLVGVGELVLSSEILPVVATVGASCSCDLWEPATDGAGVVALGCELSDVGAGEALGENRVAAVGVLVEGVRTGVRTGARTGARTVGDDGADGEEAGDAVFEGDGVFKRDGRLGFMFIIIIMFILFIMFIFPVGGLPVGRHFELLLFDPLQLDAGREPIPETFELQPQLLWTECPEEPLLLLLAPLEGEPEPDEVS